MSAAPVVDGQRLVDALVRRLDVEADGALTFRALPGRGSGIVFGGMLLGQAVTAAGKTVDGRAPHALHAQFLRAASYDHPLVWNVDVLRDGVGFSTRRVSGRQQDREVFTATVGFAVPTTSTITHGDAAPDVPAPDGLPDWEAQRARILGDPSLERPPGPLDVRDCHPEDAAPDADAPARRRLWIRTRGSLPHEPLVHAAVLAFASDRGFLSTAARPHGIAGGARFGASLDHALWWHLEPRLDVWTLFASESPVAVAGRALVQGGVYDAAGRRIASISQEGLIKLDRRRPPSQT